MVVIQTGSIYNIHAVQCYKISLNAVWLVGCLGDEGNRVLDQPIICSCTIMKKGY